MTNTTPDLFEQEYGTETSCPQRNGQPHVPDWTTLHTSIDVDVYVDVSCRHCGRSGCLGTVKRVVEDITW